MRNYISRLLAVFFAGLAAALASNAAATDANSDWSLIQTRSGPVPFSPDLSGQYSELSLGESIRQFTKAAGLGVRSIIGQKHANSDGPLFSGAATIASIENDDMQ